MDKEELKKYLKENLEIKWRMDYVHDDLYIVLTLEGEEISKIPFARE